MRSSFKIAVIGGDGIGPEVTAEALKVLRAAAPDIGFDTPDHDLGARLWHRTGETLPNTVLEEIRKHDAILLGAIGDPSAPSGVLERGVLLWLRFELDHYVNLRPVKLFPGVSWSLVNGTPETIDMVVIREGTEGPYTGAGGVIRAGTPQEIAAIVQWAFCSLNNSPGARAFYDQHRAAGDVHHQALRALGDRLVAILHGCLRHHNTYSEHTAWAHRQTSQAA